MLALLSVTVGGATCPRPIPDPTRGGVCRAPTFSEICQARKMDLLTRDDDVEDGARWVLGHIGRCEFSIPQRWVLTCSIYLEAEGIQP